jgi:hypothetical protein
MRSLLLSAILLVCLAVSCTKDNGSSGGNSHMNVYLTDGPGSYSAVNIDVQDVQVKAGSDTSENGWQSLHIIAAGEYNLLDFNNGMDTLIASMDMPAGKISQIRLVLGSNNNVVLNGISYPLTTPSAQQSGLKLNLDANLVAGVAYNLWLDFDAGKSIVATGGGKFMLKPVIRAFVKAESGAIMGIALPVEAKASIYAIAPGNDTISTTIANPLTGMFQLNGLPAGTYSVAVDGSGSFSDTTLTNVSVTTGMSANVGTVQLH